MSINPRCLWIMAINCLLCILVGCGCFVYVFAKNQQYTLTAGCPCTTPNGETASCQTWFDCMIILNALTNQVPLAPLFAQASQCGETPLVCCGSIGSFVTTNRTTLKINPKNITILASGNKTKQAKIEFALKKLLPSTKHCGLHYTDDVYNKSETSLDEFPWLVYIPHSHSFLSGRSPGVQDIGCTGFLISNRYVLTERNCGWGEDIEKVYIGQSSGCFENQSLHNCTDLLEVKVTESIYPDVKSIYISNFRLLRLEKKIAYSDYIRPICLPLDEIKRAEIGDTVVTSGWSSLNVKETRVKKRFKHTLESVEQKICASPQNVDHTVCQGDDGGPLMYSYRHRWFAEGVLNSDDTARSCDAPNEFMCATRITPVNVEWILLNMKP